MQSSVRFIIFINISIIFSLNFLNSGKTETKLIEVLICGCANNHIFYIYDKVFSYSHENLNKFPFIVYFIKNFFSVFLQLKTSSDYVPVDVVGLQLCHRA